MLFQEKFEDTKGAIRTGKSKKDGQYKDKTKRTKVQTMFHKTAKI